MVVTDVCVAIDEEDDIYGAYSWPTTPVGVTASVPCVYNVRAMCNNSHSKFAVLPDNQIQNC